MGGAESSMTSLIINMNEGGGESRPGGVEKKPILDTSVLKAFVAGIIAGNLNKGLVLGFAIGAVGGVYVQQNLSGVPDVRETWRRLVQRWKESGGKR